MSALLSSPAPAAPPRFHRLALRRITPEAAQAAVLTFEVPAALRGQFDFRPGQFLTLRANVAGSEVRRSYSICSARARLHAAGELEVAVKPVEGGVFSRWAAATLQPGDTLDVMPPDGRFTPRAAPAAAGTTVHRVGFAAGSGITPLLAIIATTLAEQPGSRFTLVYGNQRTATIMFNEALQDLKDKYPARLTLLHVLSRQAQETALLNGRLDAGKVRELLATLLPVNDIDEAFVCGPEGMIDAVEGALRDAGLDAGRIHTERFFAAGSAVATHAAARDTGVAAEAADPQAPGAALPIALGIVIDGKTHALGMAAGDNVLDAALAAGLDLPYSCKGGVCCTCRARVLEGRVEMVKNFTLEPWEVERGFVLTCQARPLTPRVVVSYDER